MTVTVVMTNVPYDIIQKMYAISKLSLDMLKVAEGAKDIDSNKVSESCDFEIDFTAGKLEKLVCAELLKNLIPFSASNDAVKPKNG